jgi:tRNA(Ile)-lysidine synthase
MNLNKIVQQFINTLPNLEGKKIAVGYSAGADSTALLHILEQKSRHLKFNLEAVFFSHLGSPINEGEDKNLELARDFCKSLNIPLVEVDLQLVKHAKKSWEQLGRNGRLNFYKNSDYDFAFLGHHKDDQNETTMMQIMRGGGKAASGMKARDGIYCRPLLDVPKSEIYDYLNEKDLKWIEDPTNENTDFTRNFWRNVGLPTIEKHYPNYSDLLNNFRDKNNSLFQLAFDMAKVDGLENFLAGNPISVKSLPDYRIQNLISQSFQFIGNSVENKRIDTLLSNGTKKNPSCMDLGDFSISYDGKSLCLSQVEHKKQHKLKT